MDVMHAVPKLRPLIVIDSPPLLAPFAPKVLLELTTGAAPQKTGPAPVQRKQSELETCVPSKLNSVAPLPTVLTTVTMARIAEPGN